MRDTLIIAALHSPGVFAYLFRGQNDVGVPHEIQQQGKFAGPQIDQPPAYFHDSARRVYEKIPHPERNRFCIGWISIMIILCISPQLCVVVTSDYRI